MILRLSSNCYDFSNKDSFAAPFMAFNLLVCNLLCYCESVKQNWSWITVKPVQTLDLDLICLNLFTNICEAVTTEENFLHLVRLRRIWLWNGQLWVINCRQNSVQVQYSCWIVVCYNTLLSAAPVGPFWFVYHRFYCVKYFIPCPCPTSSVDCHVISTDHIVFVWTFQCCLDVNSGGFSSPWLIIRF